MLAMPAEAQTKLKFSIASFEQDPTDLSAQSAEYKKVDGSGSLYAIIKVTSNNPDDDLREYQFNFGSLKHTVEEHDGELWIYVQRNAKTVSITRNGYAPIQRYDLRTTIQPGKNYVMQLSSAAKVVYTQMTRFSVTPANANAIVLVKGGNNNSQEEFFGVVNSTTGEIAKSLEYGIYTYRVISDNYHTVEGRFMLSNRNTILHEPIILRPRTKNVARTDSQMVRFKVQPLDAKAVILVKRSGSDETEMLFNVVDARTGMAERFLPTGNYSYRVISSDYHEAEGAIGVSGKHSVAEQIVELVPNFGTVTMNVNIDADIYVNNEKRGTRTWSGRLKAGTYPVECRMANHSTTLQYVKVEENKTQTITLDSPTPINGTLALLCTPDASISIDGKNVGVTPLNLEVIIGSHNITFSRENYKSVTKTAIVSENQVTNVSATLQDFTRMTIDSRPEGALLIINGDSVGVTPYTNEMTSGNYDIRLSYPGYRSFGQRVHLDSSNPFYTFKLDKQYQVPSSFYVQAGAQVGTLMGVGVSIGGYFHNFNVEAVATIGMAKENMYLNYIDNSGNDSRLQELKPLAFGGRLGYGIIIGTRMRVTPQVGVQLISVKANDVKGYATCSTVGLRFEYVLASHFGVSATGEGVFAVSKSDSYKQFSDLSSKVKGWGTGGNLRLGAYIFF